jgi:hypothetical protein
LFLPQHHFHGSNAGLPVTTLLIYAAGLIVVFVVLAVVALIYLTVLDEDHEHDGNKD